MSKKPGIDLTLTTIRKHFDIAKGRTKFPPRIKVDTLAGQTLVLKMMSDKSRHPGAIEVSDGQPGADRTRFAYIWENGTVTTALDCTGDVIEYLTLLEKDFVGVLAAWGKRNARCPISSKPLTHKNSLDVGYGPISAEQFGLPHEGWTVAVKRVKVKAKMSENQRASLQHCASVLRTFAQPQVGAHFREGLAWIEEQLG